MKGFTEILRGANGGLELNRVVGALGGVAYIVAAPAFQTWHMANGSGFDVTAFCLAYAGGLATLGIGTGAAVAIKDRNVASAKVIEKTHSKPSIPPAPPPETQPDEGEDETDAGLPDTLR